MSIESRLTELGITLPPPPKKLGLYEPILRVGNLAYLSGHLPLLDDGTLIKGKLGVDLSVEQGQAAARQAGLNLLATLQKDLGSLDKVSRLIKSFGIIACADDFADQPAVMNGFSELFAEVFGETNGVGARSAIGTNALPAGIPVEIEIIVEVKE